MFKLFRKKEPEKIIEQVMVRVPCCDCNFNNKYCDLIDELHKYQEIQQELLKEIELLRDGNNINNLLFNFIELLKSLENYGFTTDSYARKYFDNYYLLGCVQHAIRDYSYEGILKITEELRTYKNKDNIIMEKEKSLIEIKKKIQSIKNELGIM